MDKFPPHTQWDIFCSVVDNFGDIGVCWRLARQLANEQQVIRLWVDDLKSFQKICPQLNPILPYQLIENICIYQWNDHWQALEPADIVLETFACSIPTAYIQAMAKTNRPIFWVNLDYLTYENWSVQFHALPSLQPCNLNKYFFFPGLEQTGGLIREAGLLEQAALFQSSSIAQQQFLAQLGIHKEPNSFLMFIFCYANQALTEWLDALKQTNQSYQLLIPQTPLLANLANYLKVPLNQLTPYYTQQINNIKIHIIPFVNQTDFDKLLWCADYNLIRGEDSFVRAQYAGKPMLWHIYPQQDNAHLIKLEAFLEHYLAELPCTIRQATLDWWLAWNNQKDLANTWLTYHHFLPELKENAVNWVKKQKSVTDLTTKLAKLYKNWL